MTAAFRTLCHSLGLSAQTVATIGRVPERTARHWFSTGQPPADVLSAVQALDNISRLHVIEAVEAAQEAVDEHGDKPESIELRAYRTESEWWAAHPAFSGLPIQAHSVMLHRVAEALKQTGFRVEIRFVN